MQRKCVLLLTGHGLYPRGIPCDPPECYPELGFLEGRTDPTNRVYPAVRDLLRALGYDGARYGAPEWSPLSELVAAGGKVVLKPNFVRHYNEDPAGDLDSVVTHLAVLRPLIDYALKAVGPRGSVIVADAPQYDCDVRQLLARNRLQELLEGYRGLGREVEWRDLRLEYGRHQHGIQLERHRLKGDPEGYEIVDLGAASEFAALEDALLKRLRGADYDEQITIRHHREGRNEYLVSRTVLTADLLINCPKIKTHKKSGVSLSMKNLIGINGDKNWLPHYRAGFRSEGGDEFPRVDGYSRVRRVGGEFARRMLKRGIGSAVFRRIRAAEEAVGLGRRARNGDWHGNDTIWRTSLDLNKIVYLGDQRGVIGSPNRRVLNVFDGIVAGEGNGPMGPRARPLGLLAAGEGAEVDYALTWIMGFDWRRIPLLQRAAGELAGGVRLTQIAGDPEDLGVVWIEGRGDRTLRLSQVDLNLGFAPHPGWVGHLERDREAAVACAS